MGHGLALLVLAGIPLGAIYLDERSQAEQLQGEERADALDSADAVRLAWAISVGLGAGLTLAGAPLLAVGLARRDRRRQQSEPTLSLSPAVGVGRVGLGATLRF